MAFRVKRVCSKSDIDAFHRLPFEIHSNDENWRPPFRDDVDKIFDPNRNERFSLGGECERFLVFCDEKIAGRFSLFTDPQKDSKYDPELGGLGLIEFRDIEGITTEIVEFAKGWFKERGYSGFRGPVNFGENDRYWGIQISGFDQPNVYGMMKHAPYYESQLKATNPEKFDDLYMYRRSISQPVPERLIRITDRLAEKAVEVKAINKRDLHSEGEKIRNIYNAAFSDQVVAEREEEFPGITEQTLRDTIKQLKPVLMPETTLIAYVNGEPASFLVSVPDLNELSAQTGGRIKWWHFLKVLRLKRTVSRVRPLAFGTLPKHRGKGLEALIWRHGLEQLRTHYPNVKEMEGGFVSEKNWIMRRSLEALGCEIAKTYRVYKWEWDD